MGATKGAPQLQPQSDDAPGYSEPDTGPSSSAVLLDDIGYPDEELPAYSNEPVPSTENDAATPHRPSAVLPLGWYKPPPDLIFSSHDMHRSEYRTLFPDYSTDANTLYTMIREQAFYAPSYYVLLNGTHTRTRRNHNGDTKERITDFYIRLNLTRYLQQDNPKDVIRLLPGNKRGYRGTRFPSFTPSVSINTEDGEDTDAELRSWCERYVADKSPIKCFTLQRKVINHNTARLTQLLRSCIQETGYRGRLQITFSIQHETVVVYSPGVVNLWRTTNWIRWVFYLSMLWIISWPILKLCTARYDVLKAVYPYANKKPGEGIDDGFDRVPTVMSEVEWFLRWESAIKRAALSRMRCDDISLSEEYRQQCLDADMRGREYRGGPGMPNTGDDFTDALGYLGEGLRLVGDYTHRGGWGRDNEY